MAGVVFPTTATEIANFSIPDFLIKASLKSPSSFAAFHRTGRIKEHVASLLVVSDSSGPRNTQRSLRDEHHRKKGDHKKTTSRAGVKGYQCGTCNTWHATGQHTDEGKRLLQKKYGSKSHQKKEGTTKPPQKI